MIPQYFTFTVALCAHFESPFSFRINSGGSGGVSPIIYQTLLPAILCIFVQIVIVLQHPGIVNVKA